MTTAEVLKKEFDLISKELTEKYDQLGMRASGRWEREKEVKIKESGTRLVGTIWGASYTGALEFGRGPTKGKGGSGKTLRDAIYQWIIDKRITSEIPIRSLAFLIARKIHKVGWKRERYGGVELISSVITTERIDQIIQKVGTIYVDVIVRGLVKELENFAKEAA